MAVKSQLKPAKQTEAQNVDDRNKVAVYSRVVAASDGGDVLECLCVCVCVCLISFHFHSFSIFFSFSFFLIESDVFLFCCRYCETSMKFNGAAFRISFIHSFTQTQIRRWGVAQVVDVNVKPGAKSTP